jgi:hypothetical protein
MTARKHLKQLVRARMQKTGESYSAARRQILRDEPSSVTPSAEPAHLRGTIPATTAFGVLLSHARVKNLRTGVPYSDALLFAICGGIGAGMFTFVYDAWNFASFFVAGRHKWQDDQDYLESACTRFGLTPVVRETAGAKQALGHLQEALASGPCIAWVDMAHLPHRALPAQFSGGGYHVITVYRIDEKEGVAYIGDLSDEPIRIGLADLATARARIKKQKHRLLSLSGAATKNDAAALVRDGLRSCYQGLLGGKGKWAASNFTLRAFETWGMRMHDSKDKEAWERIFTPGSRLWSGLTSIHEYIEHYGTGGGLCRPHFADALAEAARIPGLESLEGLAEQYKELGRGWSELADAALPESVPLFREAKSLVARRSELMHDAAASDPEEIRGIWKRLGELKAQVAEAFPLSERECRDLRAQLQRRILKLYADEVTAHEALGSIVAPK